MTTFTLGRFWENHLRRVLIADVAHAAIAADRPHFGQLQDLKIGHERVAKMREVVVLARRDDILFATEQRIGKPLGDDGATAMIDDEALPSSQPTVTPSWKSEFIQGIRIDLWDHKFKRLRGAYFNDELGPTVMLCKGLPEDPMVRPGASKMDRSPV
jgi:hypothetical protein